MVTSNQPNNSIAAIPQFNGFGPSILVQQTRGRISRYRLPEDRLEGRQMLREECPRDPGVYGWLNHDGQLIYVGKSKCLRARLLSYFDKNPTERKMERIRQQSGYLIWEPISDELLALLREQELIFRWTPEFNSMGQPNRQLPAFLCVSKSAAPNLFSTSKLTDRVAKAWGPITGSGRLSEAATCCNYQFQLRDCPEKTRFEFSNQLQLFEQPARAKCIRNELGSCPAPCASCCSSSQYQAGLNEAVDFLEGRTPNIVKELEVEMHRLAGLQRFEQAAVLRERFKTMRWLDGKLKRLRICRSKLNGVLPVKARRNRTVWLILRGGQLTSNFLIPGNLDSALDTADELEMIANQAIDAPSNRLDIKLQIIIASWFRKQKHWYDKIIPFENAVDLCRSQDLKSLPMARSA